MVGVQPGSTVDDTRGHASCHNFYAGERAETKKENYSLVDDPDNGFMDDNPDNQSFALTRYANPEALSYLFVLDGPKVC